MVVLRTLRECDVTQIRGWPAYQGDMEQMDYALREKGWLEGCDSKPGAVFYAAEDGDGLIGFSILVRTDAASAEFRIALRADKTGLGLGEMITCKTLQAGFEDQGFSLIHLIVRKNNNRGINLYRRIGFVDCGECRKEIQGIPVDFRLMKISHEVFAQYSLRGECRPLG